jgi:hypothetical protein
MKPSFLKLGALTALLLLYLLLTSKAQASTLSISPPNGPVHLGEILPVRVNLDTSGSQITSVSTYLTYPSDKFDVAWIDGGLSAFSFQINQEIASGVIKISRNNGTPLSGQVPVIDIGLKAKNLGPALLAFTSGSIALRASDNGNTLNLGSSHGGSYVVTSQPVNGNHSAPLISNISVSNVKETSFTVSWQTDEPSTSEVTYGFLENQYIYQAASTSLTTNHQVNVSNSPEHPLIHGSLVHFRIKSKDQSGNLSTSSDKNIRLIGLSIHLRFITKSGDPIPDTVASLKDELSQDTLEATTDRQGYTTFTGVSVGKHQAFIDNPEKYYQINVTEESAGQTFNVSIDYSFQFFPNSLMIIVASCSIVAIVVSTILLVKRPFKRPKLPEPPSQQTDQPKT